MYHQRSFLYLLLSTRLRPDQPVFWGVSWLQGRSNKTFSFKSLIRYKLDEPMHGIGDGGYWAWLFQTLIHTPWRLHRWGRQVQGQLCKFYDLSELRIQETAEKPQFHGEDDRLRIKSILNLCRRVYSNPGYTFAKGDPTLSSLLSSAYFMLILTFYLRTRRPRYPATAYWG